jgi:hypothetical protein
MLFPSTILSELDFDISSIAIADIYDAYEAVIHTRTLDYPLLPSSSIEYELKGTVLAFQPANGKKSGGQHFNGKLSVET